MTGFESPNYTQVPNDYFDLVMEMTEAENRILAALLRATFGYHRDEVKLSIRELAKITKLSTSSIWVGMEKLKKRGLIERSVSKFNTVSTWRLVVEDAKLYRQIIKTVSASTGELKVKEIKEIKEKERAPDFHSMTVSEARKLPTLKMYAEATDFFPGSVIWEFVDNFIRENKLTLERIHIAAEAWALAGYKRENVKGILEWAVGEIPEKHRPKNMIPIKPKVPAYTGPDEKDFKAPVYVKPPEGFRDRFKKLVESKEIKNDATLST